MKPVKYGIIGFGGIAENRIAKEGFGLDSARFKQNPDAVLYECYDANPARREAAQALGIKWAQSAEALLQNKEIEAVIIATNNASHTRLAFEALKANKHVFIEKPLGTKLEEAVNLVDYAKRKGLSLSVDHMMIKNVYNTLARKIINSNELGSLEHCVLHMEFPYGFALSEAKTWRCSIPEELGGPIGDVGSHCFYMAEYLLSQRITAVQCVYNPRRIDIAVENGAIIYFVSDAGMTGTIRVAFNEKRGALPDMINSFGYEVYGSKAVLESRGSMFQLSGYEDEIAHIELSIVKNNRRIMQKPEAILNEYASQISEHAVSIRKGPILEGTGALHNLEIILRAHESACDDGKSKKVLY